MSQSTASSQEDDEHGLGRPSDENLAKQYLLHFTGQQKAEGKEDEERPRTPGVEVQEK